MLGAAEPPPAALSAGAVDGAVDAPPPVDGAGVLPPEHAPTTTARLARVLANRNFVFTVVFSSCVDLGRPGRRAATIRVASPSVVSATRDGSATLPA